MDFVCGLYIAVSYIGMYLFCKWTSKVELNMDSAQEGLLGAGLILSPLVAPLILAIFGSWWLGKTLFGNKI